MNIKKVIDEFIAWAFQSPDPPVERAYRQKLEELLAMESSEINKNFTFFWKGPLSQWSYSPFRDNTGKIFSCAEQYMMYCKALLFGDTETAEHIMRTPTPREMQALGRRVFGFAQKIWDEKCEKFVYEGNCLKFRQNPKHREELFKTAGTTLVEASPIDRIWGIGLNEEIAKVTSPEKWQGKNLLGKILTRVRDDLMKEGIK